MFVSALQGRLRKTCDATTLPMWPCEQHHKVFRVSSGLNVTGTFTCRHQETQRLDHRPVGFLIVLVRQGGLKQAGHPVLDSAIVCQPIAP